MKKKLLIILSILLLIVLGIILYLVLNNKKFELDNKYTNNGLFDEINYQELNSLILDKDTFLVFVYQDMCIASSDFEDVLNEFINKYPITIKKIAFSEIKDTNIEEKIKYYPSFLIYHKGKLIDYLRTDEEKDTKIFQNAIDFENWLKEYIILPEEINNVSNEDNIDNENKNDSVEIIDDNVLAEIKKENNKVNIYFFYRDTCHICSSEKEFFASIEEEYGKYYNLYKLSANLYQDLIFEIAEVFNDNVRGVPYTIIGDKSFVGFSENTKEEMLNAIKNYNGYDVYIDEIKKG